MLTKITHITVFVKNQDDALKFYVDTLGFKVHTDAMFAEFRWLTICAAEQPDFEIALVPATTPEEIAIVGKQSAGKPLFNVDTNDCQKDYERLSALGVVFVQTPKREPWGFSSAFHDLCGNLIYMCQQ